MILLIDEIYIASKLQYRSNELVGYASNSNELAKTILAFIINSASGNFSEIIKLLPVFNITGDEMLPIVGEITLSIQNCGFEVICIVTNNHKINRNMFIKLSDNGISFPNPSQSLIKLYFYVLILFI